MSDEIETEAEAVADLAARAAEPFIVDPGKVLVTAHEDHKVLDLERFLPAPRRVAGTYKPASVHGLIAYVTEHRTEHTTIWVDKQASVVTAVLNDHAVKGSGWRDHRCTVALLRSPEWTHWLSQDGKMMGQEAFAEHLQDGIEQIRDPDPATMLEIAESMQGSTKADWKTATRLDNGEVSFAYHEQIEATAGRKAHVEIPQTFDLAVSPFYGEAPAPLTARLRWRIREGTLSIGYRLISPHTVVLEVLEGIAERLRAAKLDRVYLGSSPE